MTLPSKDRSLSTKFRDATVCEACGGPFSCGAALDGCWCAEIQLSDARREDLRELYTSCLCRTCLERVAAKDRSSEPVGRI